MLGQLTRENEPHGSLDLSGGDGGPLVVGSQLGGLVGDPGFFQSHAFKFIPRILLLSSAK